MGYQKSKCSANMASAKHKVRLFDDMFDDVLARYSDDESEIGHKKGAPRVG